VESLENLSARFQNVKWSGSDKFTARCPAHEDLKASLAVRQYPERQLLHCFAGCTFEAITAALGIPQSEFFVANRNGQTGHHKNGTASPPPLSVVEKYEAPKFLGATTTTRFQIKDVDGTVFAVHVREDGTDTTGKPLKTFWWETPDGRKGLGGIKTADLPLYGMEMLPTTDADTTIVVVEGEKAARSLVRRGICAVGTVCGASATPNAAVLQALKPFRDVVLWPDNDDAGRKHMERLAVTLQGMGVRWRRITWPDAPAKGDAADFEGNQDAILGLIGTAEPGAFDHLPAVQNGLVPALPVVIPWEGFDQAVAANEEYLKRIPVIDKLCYSSAVSMITGGKHAGKSTLARWMAICVANGYEFLKRSVQQGPVLYIASEDETMAARQELIRLGWKAGDSLRFLSAARIPIDDQREFLRRLTSEIVQLGAVLVIIDMLFDFVPISDEMSYAGTREAVGLIQEVASQSKAHIVAIHHAPKNAMIGDAAVAALGSQGLAARVSPIILVRRFGPGVHSISSTSVRDPRGEPIAESKLVRNEDGSVELGGGWKNYMLAEVYMERVKEMLDEDPGTELTAPEISEALTISYQVARGCLAALFRNGLVNRSGSGKKGKPFRYASLLSDTNSGSEIQNTVHTPLYL
jgi:5S rRNA maturation endonuclease (ribonuclease M5)